MAQNPLQPNRATVMIKPVGALCNLECHYCYYLPTKNIFGGREHRMSLETLESVFASVLPRFGDEVTIAWQGGEPTLAGLDFFKKAIEFQNKYRRPGQQVGHALQTNGTLLNEAWCAFLREQHFLVGLSLDGPPHLHDHYRLDHKGGPSADRVVSALNLMKRTGVEYNILAVLNDHTVEHPGEVFSYLLNTGTQHVQFVPAIEWEPDPEHPGERRLAPFSPRGEAYGRFLCRVFDLWFQKHRHKVSVRLFDALLNKLVLDQMPFCILDGSCHNQVTIEHDGSVFGCDHFVARKWQLGGINAADMTPQGTVPLTIGGRELDADEEPEIDDGWYDRLNAERLGTFAARKQDLREDDCGRCQWRQFCYGGCPKHRPHGGDVPEPSVLCSGYKAFFRHAMPKLEWLASYLRQNELPPEPGTPVGPRGPARGKEVVAAPRGPARGGGGLGGSRKRRLKKRS